MPHMQSQARTPRLAHPGPQPTGRPRAGELGVDLRPPAVLGWEECGGARTLRIVAAEWRAGCGAEERNMSWSSDTDTRAEPTSCSAVTARSVVCMGGGFRV